MGRRRLLPFYLFIFPRTACFRFIGRAEKISNKTSQPQLCPKFQPSASPGGLGDGRAIFQNKNWCDAFWLGDPPAKTGAESATSQPHRVDGCCFQATLAATVAVLVELSSLVLGIW